MGAVIYPIYGKWVWGGGWLAHLGTSLHLGPRRGRLRRLRRRARHRRLGGARPGDGARAPHREVQQGRHAERDPGPQHRLRRDRHARSWCSAGWASTPARRSARPTCASRVVAVNTLLAGVLRLRHGDGLHQLRSTASPTSRCRATACSPASSRSPRRARSSRRGPRASSASSPASLVVLQRLVLRPRRPRRRPVRRDLGARRLRRVGRARRRASSPTARTAPAGTASAGNGRRACFYGDGGQLVAQIAPRRRRVRLGVGHHVDHLHDRQAVHADPGVARGRDRGPRHAGVRRARATPTSCSRRRTQRRSRRRPAPSAVGTACRRPTSTGRTVDEARHRDRQAVQARRREGGARRRSGCPASPSPRSRASAASAATPRCTGAPSTRSSSCPRCASRCWSTTATPRRVADAIVDAARTGKIGDGKVWISPVETSSVSAPARWPRRIVSLRISSMARRQIVGSAPASKPSIGTIWSPTSTRTSAESVAR